MTLPHTLRYEWGWDWWDNLAEDIQKKEISDYKESTEYQNKASRKKFSDDEVAEELRKREATSRWNREYPTIDGKRYQIRRYKNEIQRPQMGSNADDALTNGLKISDFLGEQPHSRHPRP